MRVFIDDKGAQLFKAEKMPTIWESGLSFFKGNPSTVTKGVIAIAESIIMADPDNISARNTYRLGKDAKSLLSVYEVVALGSLCYTHARKALFPKTEKDSVTGRSEADDVMVNSLGAAQMGCLTAGEGLSAYAFMMKASIVFIGAAAEIAAAKLYSEIILGVGAVLGTFKDGMALHEDFLTFTEWNYSNKADAYKVCNDETKGPEKAKKPSTNTNTTEMSSLSTGTTDNVEAGLIEEFTSYNDMAREIKKDKTYYKLLATGSDFLKTITYLGFGALTAISLLAPSVAIAPELVFALTLSTIVWTVTRHFFQEELKKLESQEDSVIIGARDFPRKFPSESVV